MRRIYIVGAKSCEDEDALDALLAQGGDPEEIENPVCPVCGCDTLLAYEEGDEFDVLTWFCMMHEHEYDGVDAWFLVCNHPACTWEEEVERTFTPDAQTTFFDMQLAHHLLDAKIGLIGRHANDMRRLITAMERIEAVRPSRKLTAFLEEAGWRYDDLLGEARAWLTRVPEGSRVSFDTDDREVENATFVTATDDGCLVITAEGELIAVPAVSLNRYSPRSFPANAEPDPPAEETIDWDDCYLIRGDVEFVEVRGHVLQVSYTDKFGRYHVRCWEEAAALELQLTPIAEGYWEGVLRRSAIEARFELERMVKYKGIWLEVLGCRDDGCRWVRTRDAEEGAFLGFEPQRQCVIGREETGDEPIIGWDGKVMPDEVEEEKEVRSYSWPIPEAR